LNGHLPLRPGDEVLEQPYVLVVGTSPTYRIVGWIKNGDGRQDLFFQKDDDPPWWKVPQSALIPFK
jgi:hypothetical protein